MRIQTVALRAAGTATISVTALAAALISAPAQASGHGARSWHPAHPHPSLAAAARFAELRDANGVIAGVVDGAGGRPLTGACVVATGAGGSAFAMTQSDGRYSLGGLRPGRYTLHFSACAAGGRYMDQWSGGASSPASAATVTIARGQARELAPVTLRTTPSGFHAAIPPAIARLMSGTGLPGDLARLRSTAVAANAIRSTAITGRGAIAGNVTGRGKPLQGICVVAYGTGSGHTRTGAAGQYRIPKLKPGRYFVFYAECNNNRGNWLPQIYKNVNGPIFRRPTPIRVTAGQTTSGIDAALQLGGQISGTVRSQRGRTLPHVCIFATGKDGRFFLRNFAQSGKHGRYTMHALFPGKYQVAFVPNYCDNNGNYIPQWWRDSATQKHATAIAIKHGSVLRQVDAALRPGATISGVVRATRPHGALLKGICVYAEPVRPTGGFPTFAGGRTDSAGRYRLIGLATGRYRVFFSRGCGNNGNFLQVRRTISVIAGHATAGFDAFMPPGAIITGTVTDAHGTPVRGVCVSASGRHSSGGDRTNAEGKYSIIALQSGGYAVEFFGGCGNPGSFAPQYYRSQVNRGSADPVDATAGHTTPGIDAAMQPGGTITGVVTNAGGHPLNQVCVLIESPSVAQYGFPFNIQITRKNGVFTARNLIPGIYAVNFNCFFGRENLASQWFKGQPGQTTADFVSAPAGVVATGVNAVLRPGGFLTGKVTNSAGKPLPGICVRATLHGQPIPLLNILNYRSIAFTNGRGEYRLGPVAGAKYDVQFGCQSTPYGDQWYPGIASRASATPVTITGGATATGVNAVLTAGGSISGEVTTGAGHPQRNVCITAEDIADNSLGFAETNRQGRYVMRGLSSGSYQVYFYDCGYGRHHLPLGTATFPGAVKVVAPHTVTGVNEKLFPAGRISGMAFGGPGATPQDGACVAALPVSPNAVGGYTTTGAHGGYRLTGLAPGTYKVYFGDPFCVFAATNYAPQWYNNRTSEATATLVTVTSFGDTPNVDATLSTDGAISGTVTSHHHGPVAGECVTATPASAAPDPVSGAAVQPVIGVTAADGSYSLVGLLPGKYTVEFSVGCGDTGFLTQWWHDSGAASGATVITVSANATVTGIDASLHHHGNGQ
jgi:protocatechuate 3,4-dioxygenase beta subunit